jgi:hypothetical protein
VGVVAVVVVKVVVVAIAVRQCRVVHHPVNLRVSGSPVPRDFVILLVPVLCTLHGVMVV